MTCDDVRPRLTAYLEGELSGDRGTVVRGHLRTCTACRQAASAEAVLRDGLRALPTLDPPASLWDGIQARLAAAEVAESRRPAWRRMLARWTPVLPRIGAGGLVAAAAITLLWWRSQDAPAPADAVAENRLTENPSPEIQATVAAPPLPPTPVADDVTADLTAEPARISATYAATATELAVLAGEVRATWTDDQRTTFDTRLAELRGEVTRAAEGRPRQRALRTMIRYLQGAIVRDDVTLASGGTR